jgi:hypothetical protein
MKIHYTLDDSAARLPLAIRSEDGVWDRTTDFRNAPGIQLVELTTQHMLNTGATLADELVRYFDADNSHDSDPYGLEQCYSARAQLEDLLRDLVDAPLTAFEEVEALFPVTFMQDMNFLLALTVVGYPAFGYVRTYKDSEGEEYHGMVINLAQARPHLEGLFGEFSLSLLISVIRYGFFNHEGFLVAYDEYCEMVERLPIKVASRLKNALLSRGIAWYLSYRHNLDFYGDMLGLDADHLAVQAEQWNTMITTAYRKKTGDDLLDDWSGQRETRQPGDTCIDIVGYFAARTIAEFDGNKGLRDCIVQGPDYFIERYNTLGKHWLKA